MKTFWKVVIAGTVVGGIGVLLMGSGGGVAPILRRANALMKRRRDLSRDFLTRVKEHNQSCDDAVRYARAWLNASEKPHIQPWADSARKLGAEFENMSDSAEPRTPEELRLDKEEYALLSETAEIERELSELLSSCGGIDIFDRYLSLLRIDDTI